MISVLYVLIGRALYKSRQVSEDLHMTSSRTSHFDASTTSYLSRSTKNHQSSEVSVMRSRMQVIRMLGELRFLFSLGISLEQGSAPRGKEGRGWGGNLAFSCGKEAMLPNFKFQVSTKCCLESVEWTVLILQKKKSKFAGSLRSLFLLSRAFYSHSSFQFQFSIQNFWAHPSNPLG